MRAPPAWRWVLVACLGLFQAAAPAEAGSQKLVGRSGTKFTVGGRNFSTAFANQFYLWYKPAFMANEILADAKQMGLDTIRLFAFCEANSKDGYCFQPARGQYDEATFEKLDYVIFQARRLRVRLILPLVNNWDDNFGGMRQYVNWVKQAYPNEIPEDLREPWLETVNVNTLVSGSEAFNRYQRYHDLFYTNPHARQWYQDYVTYVLNRVNRYTRRAYKDEPAILMWELANEPRAHSDPTGQTLHAWVADMAAFIKARDPNHLLSTGSEGWYHDPGQPADWRYNGSLGADYLADHQVDGIDACSFHLYLDSYGLTEAQGLAWIEKHIADCHRFVGKPAYFGEFGVRVDRTATSRTDHLLHTFAADAEGWVVDWGFGPNSPARVASPSVDGDGALEYQLTAPIGPGQGTFDAGGATFTQGSGWDASGYDWLSGRLWVPGDAPSGLVGDFYVASGPNWDWTDGPDVALTPGQWHEVGVPLNKVLTPTMIRKYGIRLSSFASPYAGTALFDRIVAIDGALQTADVQMAQRNRLYEDWGDLVLQQQGDGLGLWYLSGLQENGQLDPDPSHFAVFYPEDDGTVDAVAATATAMAERSRRALTLWEDCEATGRGSASSGYSDATALVIEPLNVREGQGACRLDYQPSGYGKAYWEFSPLDENWVERSAIELNVFSPIQGLELSLAVSTGASWTWHESANFPLNQGWNALRVDLRSSLWKTEASQWMLTEPIADLSEVHRLSIGVFGYAAGGSVWVDPIKLTAPPRITSLSQQGQRIVWRAENDQGRAQLLTFSYRVDSGAWSSWSKVRTVRVAALRAMVGSGVHLVEVRSADRFGVISEVKKLLVTIP